MGYPPKVWKRGETNKGKTQQQQEKMRIQQKKRMTQLGKIHKMDMMLKCQAPVPHMKRKSL